MKKTILALALGAALIIPSCSLDEHPLSMFSEEEAYQSSTLIYLNTVASIYSSIGTILYGNARAESMNSIQELSADSFFYPGRGGDWVDGGNWQNLFLHNFDSSVGFFRNNWNNLFNLVGLCNSAIDKLETLKAINEDAQGYIYELRAFRAFVYYYLMDLYGEVPIVTSSSISMSDVDQSHRSAVFQFVTSELAECLPNLSSDKSQQTGEYYGRMTKAVAYMCLVKCAANAAMYATDNTSDTSYQAFLGTDMSGECKADEAVGYAVTEAGKKITLTVDGTSRNAWETIIYCVGKIEELGYTLSAKYSDNFAITNENSLENIFTVPNDEKTYGISLNEKTMSLHYSHGSNIPGGRGFNGVCATRRQVLVYGYGTDNVDEVRLSNNLYTDQDYVAETGGVVQDEGVDLSYRPLEAIVDFDATSDRAIMRQAGARIKKYEYDKTLANQGKPNWDMVVWRYADALLLKAEAQYRLGQTAAALEGFNQVRTRARQDALSALTLNDFQDERMREFAWEGTRRPDMIRFGTFTLPTVDRYVGVHHNASVNDYVQDTKGYTTVFPIPYDAISLNTRLKQNPGYSK